MSEKKALDLTKDNIFQCLMSLAVPVFGGNLLRAALQFLAAVWIGWLGAEQMAAFSASIFLIWLFFAVNGIVSAGAITLVAQNIGAKREEEAVRVSWHALLLGLISSILVSILIIIFSKSFFKSLGLEDSVALLGSHYITYVAFFMPLIGLNETIGAILTGYGNTKTPNMVTAAGIMTNMVLSPLLIYGVGFFPKLGLVGASWAMNASSFVIFSIYLFLVLKGRTQLNIKNIRSFSLDFRIVKEIIKIGLPLSISFILLTIVFMFLTKIIAQFGTPAVASLGIGHRVHMLFVILVSSFYTAISTMVGQNIGAGNVKRSEETIYSAVRITTVIGLFVTILFFLLPQQLAMLFSNDAQVVKIASVFIFVSGFSQIFFSVTTVVKGGFAGAGDTVPPMVISLIFTPLRVPLAYLLAFKLGWGVNGVWWAFTVATVLEAIVLILWFIRGDWKKMKVIEEDEHKENS